MLLLTIINIYCIFKNFNIFLSSHIYTFLRIFALQPTCCGFFITDDPAEELLKQIFYLYFTGSTDFCKRFSFSGKEFL